MPYAVMASAFREAERLHQEAPDRFNQIVTESTVSEPELAARDPLSLVAFWVYDQRVNSSGLDESQATLTPDLLPGNSADRGGAPRHPGAPAGDETAGAEAEVHQAPREPA